MSFGATLADIQKKGGWPLARVKQIIGWTAIVLFAVTLTGIWVLTEQNAVETSLLSESTARVVEGQATGV